MKFRAGVYPLSHIQLHTHTFNVVVVVVDDRSFPFVLIFFFRQHFSAPIESNSNLRQLQQTSLWIYVARSTRIRNFVSQCDLKKIESILRICTESLSSHLTYILTEVLCSVFFVEKLSGVWWIFNIKLLVNILWHIQRIYSIFYCAIAKKKSLWQYIKLWKLDNRSSTMNDLVDLRLHHHIAQEIYRQQMLQRLPGMLNFIFN